MKRKKEPAWAERIGIAAVVIFFLSAPCFPAAGEEIQIEVRGPDSGIVMLVGDINEIRAKRDYDIVATIPSNPTTGYRWQLTSPPDGGRLRLTGQEYVPGPPGLVGAGGQEVWTFRTVGLGETTISLGYLRPWEKDKPPVRSIRIKVLIFP
ncbi:MAG TPA: protease inhibitor I42 family protein [Syntrophales bacterium]|jgi:inhibitor of cysteine peptidase|nr:protease inhibitor I42 family protein [Syntrophales bacterium]HON23732.1 protease inhibitor I42 family protein [Syntrophales bacterium]HOU78308.1 protease inhibitor I42 family protein [Syntrophales bacterium]HPC31780.1 protease inhibitor I42 family protein [Syntrophales bacterium]HQG33529.1 protease inhibitor I42 family protein [Syntrophales bacterium]